VLRAFSEARNRGVHLTLGSRAPAAEWPFSDAIDAAARCGAKCEEKKVDEACVDTQLRIVTTPAYMCKTDVHHVYDGVGKLVKELLKLAKKK
jgi:enhancing lycopene biosynthesis protein 2